MTVRRPLLALLLFATAFARADDSTSTFDDTPLAKSPIAEHRATVLFFVLPDCPISNAYAPEIRRIAAEYAKRDVACYLVYVDAQLTEQEARRHAAEFGYELPVLLDQRGELVKRTGVTVAPEAVVLGPDGQRRYRGRIDDIYVDYGKRRIEPTQRDLRIALDAILAGKPVPRPTTRAIGCPVARTDGN